MLFRENQLNAINVSKNNNFRSGVHYHATGTGKSYIGLQIIVDFVNMNLNNVVVLWITEKKSILKEQFEKEKIKSRGFEDILNKYLIYNFNDDKNKNWYTNLNSSKFWNKSKLVIINRAFLTSKKAYEKINLNIDLIIHDECHSICNKSTQDFYNYILNKDSTIRCIGLTATPNFDYEPYNNLLSSYSIYDAFIDNIIVSPKIYWFKEINTCIEKKNILLMIKDLVLKQPYRKVIVWCGMIKFCKEESILWKEIFNEFEIFIDTSIDKNNDYEIFSSKESNSILFCAGKHKEGSDIYNLDTCIFIDYVENRCSQNFIQCIGRVLRKDKLNKKKYGLVIDIKAKSITSITNKVDKYLKIEDNFYPWKHEKKIVDNCEVNILELKKKDIKLFENNESNEIKLYKNSSKILKSKFIRNYDSNNINYKLRIKKEINLLKKKKLIPYMLYAMDILEITNNLIHVTRGSCGSSLVCYLLGISHIDPIFYNIRFSRFLNEFRNNLPDIDFDFPDTMRDEVFYKLKKTFPNKIARISNHVYYHDKSAVRQAIRNLGYNKFIGKNDINKFINSLDNDSQEILNENINNLNNTFKCYSLHCGGIVYYPEGVPNDLKINENKTKSITQIMLNKVDISKNKQFKVDILSSKALTQLYSCYNYKDFSIDNIIFDKKTYDLLSNGNNIGITLAESPLIRKAFLKIKPKTINDIAICLSIIRPAAKNENYLSNDSIIFDDDAIDFIIKVLNCNEDYADKIRRGFAKKDKEIINEFTNELNKIKKYTKENIKNILKSLSKLHLYSFCKSHALSYAQLVYHLAYVKANNPTQFWKSAIKHASSCNYRKWVHIYEASLYDVSIEKKNKNKSIFSKNRNTKNKNLSINEQIRYYGYWNTIGDIFYPHGNAYFINKANNMCLFNGLIAYSRIKFKVLILFICVGKNKYYELIIKKNKFFNNKMIGIKGSGTFINKQFYSIKVDNLTFY
jgi:superfamily II DNA or RNA helicase